MPKIKLLEKKDGPRLVPFLRNFGTHPYLIDRNLRWSEAAEEVARILFSYPDNGQVLLAIEDSGLLSGLLAFRKRDWDSRHFGFPAASLDYFYLEDGHRGQEAAKVLIAGFEDWRRASGIKFVSAKSYPSSEVMQALQGNGFYYVIGEFLLTKSLPDSALEGKLDTRVRFFQDSDLQDLLRITKTAPWIARFHMDKHFSKERADAFYVEWIANGVKRNNAIITVIELGNRPAGFIIWSREEVMRQGKALLVGDQELVAVDPALRGQGLGKLLYRGTLMHMQQAGLDVVKTVISDLNAPALNNQVSLGFNLNYCMAVFHKFFS